MKIIKKIFGLALDPVDQAIVDMLANSRYRQTMQVVGRGTLVIPPEEIRKSPRHALDLETCQRIVESEQKRASHSSFP